MIRINLLPVRQIKQRIKVRQELTALLIGFFAMLGVLALLGYQQTSHRTELQAETVRLTQEKEKYSKIIAKIEKIKKEQAVIEAKLLVIKGLKFTSQLPARVLDEIANLTPSDRLWLTALDYSGATLVIAGTALDNATIAEYMNRINQSALFLGAELKNSSLSLLGNQKLKTFSLTIACLAPPPPPPPATPAAPATKK
jgi:type IV pilus assembly protein PilN